MQIIAHGVEQITLSKDEILLQQGECSNAMYVLKEGLLQISVRFKFTCVFIVDLDVLKCIIAAEEEKCS